MTGVAAVALWLTCAQAAGWSKAGHMIIAATACDELSPKIRARVAETLEAHPEYEKWRDAFRNGAEGVDWNTYVSMRASTWPDEIRRRGNAFAHPGWHYINYPLRAPKFRKEEAPEGENILTAIATCQRVLGDKGAGTAERAVHLSWLLHLAGDIHQPLHCVTLIDEIHPEGDKGGNEYYVRPSKSGIRLHAFWDELLGTGTSLHSLRNYAVKLEAKHPTLSWRERWHHSPEDWAWESRSLALRKAYLNGKLRSNRNEEEAATLPKAYVKDAKTVAEKQAALAGHRLAAELKQILR